MFKSLLVTFITSTLACSLVLSLCAWLWLNGQIAFKQDKACREVRVSSIRIKYYSRYAVIDCPQQWYRFDQNNKVIVSDYHPWTGISWDGSYRRIIAEWEWNDE